MMETIAVAHSDLFLPGKRELLLFDRFGIVGFNSNLYKLPANIVAELEWLARHEIVFEVSYGVDAVAAAGQQQELEVIVADVVVLNILQAIQQKPEMLTFLSTYATIEGIVSRTHASTAINIPRVSRVVHKRVARYCERGTVSDFEGHCQHIDRMATERSVRLAAQRLRKDMHADAAALLASRPQAQMSLSESPSDAVLEIVLNDLPMPVDDTPLEQILELRQDEELRASLQRLRRWMRKTASACSSTGEIVEEVEYLTEQYRDHMRLHRAKVSPGWLRSMVVTTADVAEHTLKMQFGQAARALFAFQDRRIELAEAERKAPGRELAYLVQLSERLS